eukprot:TRINITY_DN27626_c0_g1_i1.p1 TRINITY_DN27626_c0_g1~~TRINITY_DN27626_c0_g1_i1.p1  ORF type:complete len:520 (-),score=91.49 TRINITY_DN27626_c0_g1_i1:11-1570(-)
MQVIDDDDSGSEVEVLEKPGAAQIAEEPPAKRAKVDDSEAATCEQEASLPEPLSATQIHDAVRFLRLSGAPVRASNLCTQIGARAKQQLELPDLPWSLQEFAEGDREDPFVVLTKNEAAVNRILLTFGPSVTPGVEELESAKISEVVDALRQKNGQMLVHALCGLTKVNPLQLRGDSLPWVIKTSPSGDCWVRLLELADAPFPERTSLPGMSVANLGNLGIQPKVFGGKAALTPGLQSPNGSASLGAALAVTALPKILPAAKLPPAAKPLPTPSETQGKGLGKGKELQEMPGDWHCRACGDLQFARNKKCRKCSTPKPVEDPLLAASATMPSRALTQASSAAVLAAAANPANPAASTAAANAAALNPLLGMNLSPLLAGGLLGGGCQLGSPLMNPLMATMHPLMATAQNPLMAACQNPLMAAAQNPMAAAMGLPGLTAFPGFPTAMPDQSMFAAAAFGGFPGLGMGFPTAAPMVPQVPQASQADLLAQATGGWVCTGCQTPQFAHNAYCRVCGTQNLRV